MEENKGEIAGVILEPVVGNSGFIVPDKEFLEGLREITKVRGLSEERRREGGDFGEIVGPPEMVRSTLPLGTT